MRHLEHIDTNAIEFIKDVIKAKRAKLGEDTNSGNLATYPQRCKEIVKRNTDAIQQYDIDFQKDEWGDIVEGIPVQVTGDDKSEYQNLYSFNFSPIVKYVEELSKLNNGISEMCPICEANDANTLDHFIPQTKYPLYVVHPRNLIPCCSECNGHKSANVLNGAQRIYWNAYIDNPPDEQYLFCDVVERDGKPFCKYRIQQGNIDAHTFQIIKRTFNDCNLAIVYHEHSTNIVNSLRDNLINAIIRFGDLEKSVNLVRILIQSANKNDWRLVTKNSLLDSDIFKTTVSSEYSRITQDNQP